MPEDLVRDDELAIAAFLEGQVAAGFRPAAIERLLRVQGDSLRRIAETEGEWWRSEVMEPALAAGLSVPTTCQPPSSACGSPR